MIHTLATRTGTAATRTLNLVDRNSVNEDGEMWQSWFDYGQKNCDFADSLRLKKVESSAARNSNCNHLARDFCSPVGVFKAPAIKQVAVPTQSQWKPFVAYGASELSGDRLRGRPNEQANVMQNNHEKFVSHAQTTSMENFFNDYPTTNGINDNVSATSDNWQPNDSHNIHRPPASMANEMFSDLNGETMRPRGRESATNRTNHCSAGEIWTATGERRLGQSEVGGDTRARVCNLRVCIKLPHKLHRIVIYERPKVTFATTIER